MNYYEDEAYTPSELCEIESFENSEFICCEFRGLDLRNFKLKGTKFIECYFDNCNLSNVDILGATFRDIKFSHSKCIGINFGDANSLFELKFNDSILDYCRFENVSLVGSTFIRTSFKEADFHSSTFEKCDFSESNFNGANLNGANLKSSDFSHATNFYIDVRNTNIRGCKFTMPEALNLLSPFEVEID